MKKYDDLTNRLLERRAQYVAAQKKRNKMLAGAAATLCVVALVGVAVWQSADAPPPPPVTMGTTTTTTTTPAKTEDTTTTATTSATTTDGGAVAPTTTATTTATGESTTPSKTNPTKTTATTSGKTASSSMSTIPSKTQATTSKTRPTGTVTQTQPTASQTQTTAKPTQTTQTTATTKPTVPPQTDDYIIVETPAGSEPSNPYMISAKIPAQCSASDEYVPISLSYGVVTVGSVKDQPLNSYMVLYLQDDEENIAILKRIDRQLFFTEYSIEILWDDDRMWPIDYIYSHTETILFPLSLCSEDSGRIWIVLADGTSDEIDGILTDGYLFCVSSICFDYVRSGTSVAFHIVN